jgi:hypothetical protein
MVIKVTGNQGNLKFLIQSLTRAEKHVGLHEKRHLLLTDFNKNWNVRKILVKSLNIKFSENPLSRSGAVSRVRTDRHILTSAPQGCERA